MSAGSRSGLLIVGKAAGMTSFDVVTMVRRRLSVRRVGHAGTLDPMATGVLVLGIERATRVLGYLTLAEKSYDATIRLGVATNTDDAEGEVVSTTSADAVSEESLHAGLAALTGELDQVPSSFSAVKVDGVRSYARARAGEAVELAARRVTVSRLDLLDLRREAGVLDLDVSLDCSSGTYVRALARDLGAALGVGGHLTALRRTRVGPYTLDRARTLEQLAESFDVVPLAEVVAATFPRRDVDEAAAVDLSHGRRLPARGDGPGPVGVFGPDGRVLALVAESGDVARPLVVFAPA